MTTQLAPLVAISRRSMLRSEQLAKYINDFLIRRKLNPAFSAFLVTRWNDMDIFIAVLDTEQIPNQNPYKGDLLHQLSTDLGGLPVYLSNTTGLRYVVPLTSIPKMPRKIDLPAGSELSGRVALGQDFTGRVITETWQKLGHLLVTGITGSGKSMLLRSLVVQALRDDMLLALSDLDGTTFPIPAGHPALFAPITQDSQGAQELIQRVLGECENRKILYQSVRGAPENIDQYNELARKAGKDPLKRILLILDEFSSTLMALGGVRSGAGETLSMLGMRGRKFGVSVVFAAHEFTKEQVGPLRGQCNAIIAFRTNSKELATKLGCKGAELIPADRAGLCITSNWGPMQAYFADKSLLMMDGEQPIVEPVDPDVARLFTSARDYYGGRVTGSLIQEMLSVSAREAANQQRAWSFRGWLAKDKAQGNAYVLTDRILALLGEKPKTAKSRENPEKPAENRKTDENGEV
jgi:hypothetical protein